MTEQYGTASGTLRDLGGWLDVIAELLEQPRTQLPHGALATLMTSTFGAYATSWSVIDAAGRTCQSFWPAGLLQGGVAGDYRSGEQTHAMHLHPLVQWMQTSQSTQVQTTDGVPDAVVDRRARAAWREGAGPYGIEHQLAIPLYVRGSAHRIFAIARPGEPFNQEEVELASRIGKLVAVLDRQARALGGPRSPEDEIDMKLAKVQLTARQLATLRLLAQGLTAASTARRLGVSPRTVHKHTEQIYRRLGVRDRLAAVLRASALGLLDPAMTKE